MSCGELVMTSVIPGSHLVINLDELSFVGMVINIWCSLPGGDVRVMVVMVQFFLVIRSIFIVMSDWFLNGDLILGSKYFWGK